MKEGQLQVGEEIYVGGGVQEHAKEDEKSSVCHRNNRELDERKQERG